MTKTVFKKMSDAYELYSEKLFRHCLFKVSSADVATDLVQETFLRAWRYVGKGNDVENIKAFLYRILGNLIVDEYRSRKNVDSLERLSEDGFDPGFDDTGRWMELIDGRQILGLLKKIKNPYRDTLFMKYVKEFSIGEIAEQCHASKNTVAVRLHRGTAMLRKLFSKNETAMR